MVVATSLSMSITIFISASIPLRDILPVGSILVVGFEVCNKLVGMPEHALVPASEINSLFEGQPIWGDGDELPKPSRKRDQSTMEWGSRKSVSSVLGKTKSCVLESKKLGGEFDSVPLFFILPRKRKVQSCVQD